ncbi:MAG: hypothetical protein R6V73_12570 [Anaerolineales bacterium]
MVANASHPSSALFGSRRQRAFATHPHHSRSEAVFQAGILLKGRSFQADKYNDRKTPAYWLKFEYPFWWNNLLSALDSLSRLGFSAQDAEKVHALIVLQVYLKT